MKLIGPREPLTPLWRTLYWIAAVVLGILALVILTAVSPLTNVAVYL